MLTGIIEDGTFRGRQIILDPRTNLKDNEWLIESGMFANGSTMFRKHCLSCSKPIANSCPTCDSKEVVIYEKAAKHTAE